MFDNWIVISCVLLTLAECGVMITLHYIRPFLINSWIRELGLSDLKSGISAKQHEIARLSNELREASDVESSLNATLRKLNEDIRQQEHKPPVLLHSPTRSSEGMRPFACAVMRTVTIDSKPLKSLWSRENIALIWAVDENDATARLAGLFPRALQYLCGPVRDTIDDARSDWAIMTGKPRNSAASGGTAA